jgi:hypothetical protein
MAAYDKYDKTELIEECAKIAEDHVGAGHSRDYDDACHDIAGAIRDAFAAGQLAASSQCMRCGSSGDVYTLCSGCGATVTPHERNDEGIDFALMQLCSVLGVDPQSVTWDAAAETCEGDVQAVIGNILRTKFGEDWDPASWATPSADAVAPIPLHDGWQPIETAPRDRMFIWAYQREGKWSVGVAYRNVSGGWSDAYGNLGPPKYATHWAPMPTPPALSRAERQEDK